MNNDLNKWVDNVIKELESLFNRDKNYKKYLLGNDPLKKIIDEYTDWMSWNTTLTPKVAANDIYKDVIKVGYFDFIRKMKKTDQRHAAVPSFSLIYGTGKEIEEGIKLLNQLKAQNPKRYDLIVFALEKIKEVSDKVQPSKNIFGKQTTSSIKKTNNIKMPRLETLRLLLNMNDSRIRTYINRFHTVAQPTNKPQAAYKQPYDPNISRPMPAYKQPVPAQPIPQATQPIPTTTP